jgi:hypothetical protein
MGGDFLPTWAVIAICTPVAFAIAYVVYGLFLVWDHFHLHKRKEDE